MEKEVQRMSYTEWKHGWITDEEYADEYTLDKMREARFGAVEDEEDDEGLLKSCFWCL